MITPFINPINAPRNTLAIIEKGRLPVLFIRVATTTPEKATAASTERSKSPPARQNNIVEATIPTIETDNERPIILGIEKKFGTNKDSAINMITKKTETPALVQKAVKILKIVLGFFTLPEAIVIFSFAYSI
jgi:hypothetical protein